MFWTDAEKRESIKAAIAERLAHEPLPTTIARIRKAHAPDFDWDGDEYQSWKIGPYCAECGDEWPCDFYILTYRRQAAK